MRVAVVGGGISGLVSAYQLSKAGIKVVLYEKEEHLGGHAKTITVGVEEELGFMVFNRVTYPNMMEFFETLGVDIEISDMSFSVSLDDGNGCEWGSRNGLSSLFAKKRNILNPYFWKMIREITKFKDDVLRYLEEAEKNQDISYNQTLGEFINSHGYSDLFQKAYIVPICSSIWSCPAQGVMSFSAFSVLSFCRNHHLLQLFGRPQWFTVRCRSQTYVKKVKEELENRGCQIRTGCAVQSVSKLDDDCVIICEDGKVFWMHKATHAPDTLNMLGEEATHEEKRILGSFIYVYSDIFLHRDKSLMPQNPSAWSSWNFLGTMDNRPCLTYWLNVLQNIDDKGGLPYLVTLNPPRTPERMLVKWRTGHPVPSVAASKASLELDHIQGKRGIWFCGAYQGYGFHEDGLKAGMLAASGVLNRSCQLVNNPKHMVPSLLESGARLFVVRFLQDYIAMGKGGTMFTFEGTRKNSPLKVYLKVHNPQFYWKIVTQADLGLADAYINGDFSFIDKKEGLLNMFMRFTNFSSPPPKGWWTPMFLTAGVASAKQNSLTQARRNISRHYDLSNELFALFLDDSMTYSCAIFKSENEDLKSAQMRKIILLIEKARVDKNHEVLEIGCGWGTLAIEIVKRTGCKYTGITLSEEQLRYAETKVKEAGLQKLLAMNTWKSFLGVVNQYWQMTAFLCYSKILALGFNQNFIRTWEYYFDYCAAGFKTHTLGDYQVVFSRPGNIAALGDHPITLTSAFSLN
ncbi:LOW QUALITY PROTEIN: hypothetical protein OSB04_010223 [Centaurea solstitialis]|uniref:Amine oxidase domain-containing protein n=1 Tax=Centaurea solstitialis TaxID=347529 RepID=A0AA38T8U0_9ASTR|nr:LOW QUALITY PROTEIN: hypothetical protein OSB04_010223 [Centaurea solstitialis]